MKTCSVLLLSAVFIATLYTSLPTLAYDEEPDVDALKVEAEKGDPDAQYQLGYAYQMGDGIQQNDLFAIKWITKAANQGHADAQFHLGMAYRGGYGVPQDYITAYMWLEMAVNNGSIRAFDLRRDIASSMSLDQINDAKYKAKRWKPPEEDE
jgi:TPR repeat protein